MNRVDARPVRCIRGRLVTAAYERKQSTLVAALARPLFFAAGRRDYFPINPRPTARQASREVGTATGSEARRPGTAAATETGRLAGRYRRAPVRHAQPRPTSPQRARDVVGRDPSG